MEIPAEVQNRKWITPKTVDALFRSESMLTNLVQVSLDFHFRFSQLETLVSDFAFSQPSVFAMSDPCSVTNYQAVSAYLSQTEGLSREEQPPEDSDPYMDFQIEAWKAVDAALDDQTFLSSAKALFEEELKCLLFQEVLKETAFEAIGMFLEGALEPSVESGNFDKTQKKQKAPAKKPGDGSLIDNPESHIFFKMFNKI